MSDIQNSKASTNGRWTKEEHDKFLLGLQLFGKNWKKIEGLLGTRNGSQIRSHAQKFFLKIQKENDPAENQIKQELHESQSISDPSSQNQRSTDMSYFVQQILKKTKGHSGFDFWNQLIDHGKDNNSITETHQVKRKGSFFACQQQDSLDQESSLNGEPRKIIKL